MVGLFHDFGDLEGGNVDQNVVAEVSLVEVCSSRCALVGFAMEVLRASAIFGEVKVGHVENCSFEVEMAGRDFQKVLP